MLVPGRLFSRLEAGQESESASRSSCSVASSWSCSSSCSDLDGPVSPGAHHGDGPALGGAYRRGERRPADDQRSGADRRPRQHIWSIPESEHGHDEPGTCSRLAVTITQAMTPVRYSSSYHREMLTSPVERSASSVPLAGERLAVARHRGQSPNSPSRPLDGRLAEQLRWLGVASLARRVDGRHPVKP